MDEGGKRVSWVELPPQIAYRLTCVGAGSYLVGTRAFLRASPRVPGVVRALVIVATFQLGRLSPSLGAHAYLWLLTGWVALCAALTFRPAPEEQTEAA